MFFINKPGVIQQCMTESTSQLTFACSKSTIETLEKGEICSKLTIKTPERRQWHRHGVFVVNFEHISYLFLEFLLLTLNKEMWAGLEQREPWQGLLIFKFDDAASEFYAADSTHRYSVWETQFLNEFRKLNL